jgi:hypothetical protein
MREQSLLCMLSLGKKMMKTKQILHVTFNGKNMSKTSLCMWSSRESDAVINRTSKKTEKAK